MTTLLVMSLLLGKKSHRGSFSEESGHRVGGGGGGGGTRQTNRHLSEETKTHERQRMKIIEKSRLFPSEALRCVRHMNGWFVRLTL